MPPKKNKAKVPGEVIPLPADPYNFALTPRPFKNPSAEYLAKKATAQKRTKTVKVLLLAERENELAEIARMKRKRDEKQAEMEGDGEGDEPKTTTSGETSDMEIDDEENDGNGGLQRQTPRMALTAKLPPKENRTLEEYDVLVCYSTIEAPPSLIPAKRYCDITGLEGPYTDPQTKLRYHDKDIFAHIRSLKPSAVQSYLALRGSGQPLII